MINPHELHRDLVTDYLELLSQFKAKVLKFTHLEEGDFVNSENMSIQCLRKDECGDEEYYIFWWNHYQNSENHILELSKTEDEWTIDVTSSVYKIVDKTFGELIHSEPIELYGKYISLYYANSWFRQLDSASE
jgi:hypothetical protein